MFTESVIVRGRRRRLAEQENTAEDFGGSFYMSQGMLFEVCLRKFLVIQSRIKVMFLTMYVRFVNHVTYICWVPETVDVRVKVG